MEDILGLALLDKYHDLSTTKIWIYNKYGPKEEMPVDVYYREKNDMPKIELVALNECTGKVLDIGAGAGSHALILQQKDIDVTALDISPKAAEVMKLRGIKKIVCDDIFSFKEENFDTLLLLMNGIGIAGTITMLRIFLQHAKKLLMPGGQLIFDSSDIAYLYEGRIPVMENYYGEILYQYQYKNKRSGWFSWLYVDKKTLLKIATEEGWGMEVLFEDGFDQYLVKLTVK